MNILWTVTTVVALAVLTVKNPQAVLSVCIESGTQALNMSLSLCGVYCLWLGVFQIAENCRLVEKLSILLRPVNRFLYGDISRNAANNVSLNLASNLLGIGNAATPSAIAAIKETEREEKLSRAGTMLFVLNACGVQLVPSTVIGMRAQAGSANPADILLPNFLATAASAVLGAALVFLLCSGRRFFKSEKTERRCRCKKKQRLFAVNKRGGP